MPALYLFIRPNTRAKKLSITLMNLFPGQAHHSQAGLPGQSRQKEKLLWRTQSRTYEKHDHYSVQPSLDLVGGKLGGWWKT